MLRFFGTVVLLSGVSLLNASEPRSMGKTVQPTQVEKKISPSASQKNVVINGNFETGKPAPWKIAFPQGKPAGTTVNIESSAKGNACHVLLAETAYLRLSQSRIPLQKGERYTFSGMYKTSSVFSSKIKISLADGNKKTEKLKCANTNGQWQTVEKIFTASSSQLYLLISTKGKGDFWISNIVVQPAE